MTFTYRFKLKGYYKGFFWERIEVKDKNELVSRLRKKRKREALEIGNASLSIELSPHILNEKDKYEVLSDKVCGDLNKEINKREENKNEQK